MSSDDTGINITGLAETQQEIYRFSERLGDKVTVLALRLGANYMLKKVRIAAPVKTGRLKRATVVKGSRINQRRKNGKVGVYIVAKRGKKRDDLKGAYYAKFLENGWKNGATEIPGRKFIKSTFDSHKEESVRLIIQSIEQGGQRLADAIRRRTA